MRGRVHWRGCVQLRMDCTLECMQACFTAHAQKADSSMTCRPFWLDGSRRSGERNQLQGLGRSTMVREGPCRLRECACAGRFTMTHVQRKLDTAHCSDVTPHLVGRSRRCLDFRCARADDFALLRLPCAVRHGWRTQRLLAAHYCTAVSHISQLYQPCGLTLKAA